MTLPIPAAASLLVDVVREIVEHAAKFVTGDGAKLTREAIESIVERAVGDAFKGLDAELRAQVVELRRQLEAHGIVVGLELLEPRCQAVADAFIPRGPGLVARALEGVQIEEVAEITDEDREKERLAFESLKTPEGSSER